MPIVEPEVLMDGAHMLSRCGNVTAKVLHQVFEQLRGQGIVLEAMILKPNMMLPGVSCPDPASLDEVAGATIECLSRIVPVAVAGIAFLSGGQPAQLATARLNAMNLRTTASGPSQQIRLRDALWPLTFAYGRALQQPALNLWAGNEANRVDAQRALLHRAPRNGAAARGDCDPTMDAEDAPA